MNQLNNTFKIMYKNKIIHRDIKLANIVVKMNNEANDSNIKFIPKLTDYGASKQLINTISKTFIGTSLTMAPEILEGEGKDYNYKCDLWSIGIIIYQLFFKDYPYKGDTPIAIYNKIKIKGNIFLEKTNNDNLDNLIKSLLIIDPEKRINYEEYFNHPFFKYNLNKIININNYIIDEIERKEDHQNGKTINLFDFLFSSNFYIQREKILDGNKKNNEIINIGLDVSLYKKVGGLFAFKNDTLSNIFDAGQKIIYLDKIKRLYLYYDKEKNKVNIIQITLKGEEQILYEDIFIEDQNFSKMYKKTKFFKFNRESFTDDSEKWLCFKYGKHIFDLFKYDKIKKKVNNCLLIKFLDMYKSDFNKEINLMKINAEKELKIKEEEIRKNLNEILNRRYHKQIREKNEKYLNEVFNKKLEIKKQIINDIHEKIRNSEYNSHNIRFKQQSKIYIEYMNSLSNLKKNSNQNISQQELNNLIIENKKLELEMERRKKELMEIKQEHNDELMKQQIMIEEEKKNISYIKAKIEFLKKIIYDIENYPESSEESLKQSKKDK